MTHINWLHLSDWHQRGNEFDRKVVAKKMIDDIKTRKKIDEQLEAIDFIVFSGDIAFSGEKAQFQLANDLLIKPLRESVGKEVPIYYVPGNHDIQRSAVLNIPPEMARTLASENNSQIEQLLQDSRTIEHFNKPLANFYEFARKQGCRYHRRKLYYVDTIVKDGRKVGIACLNTAWLSARSNIQPRSPEKEKEFWDRGVLRTTEAQLHNALEDLGKTDLTIAVMHHPLHWLEETEQAKAEQTIGSNCHIVLHGHEHRPNMNQLSSSSGDVVTIPAGASYYRRIADDPRYTNAYNFCSVDLDSHVGTIFHRIWFEEKVGWGADERFWTKGRSLFFIQKKQEDEQQKLARKARNQLSKNYLRSVYLRPAISQDIDLRHEEHVINGEAFVMAKIRIKITFHPGETERFPIASMVNTRIVSHPDPKVSEAAYTLLTPKSDQPDWTRDGTRHEGYFEVGPNEQTIEYEYKMLETTDGLYYFNLRRFTDKVSFTLFKHPGLEYEDLPFGGFPSKQPVTDPYSKSDIWETHELAMPNQGLLVQWYPRPGKIAPKSPAAKDA
jgi:predicted phosphodiesterase